MQTLCGYLVLMCKPWSFKNWFNSCLVTWLAEWMILSDREGFSEINLPCAELPEQISLLSTQFPSSDEEKWRRNVRKCIKDKRDPAAYAWELYFSSGVFQQLFVIEINHIIYITNCITDCLFIRALTIWLIANRVSVPSLFWTVSFQEWWLGLGNNCECFYTLSDSVWEQTVTFTWVHLTAHWSFFFKFFTISI